MKKVLSILIFVVFAICLLTACNNVELSLTFDANGGAFENGEETIEVTTDGVSKVSVPKNPSKDGYEFKGWFWDNETFNKPFTANSLLDEPIQSDMTVYAKWELEEGQSQEPVTYTITFNTNGGNDISPLTIENGTTIEIPNAPTREGHSFVGWYLDNSTFDQSANDILTGEITNDITVYAKWEINTYTVTFNGNGGTLTSGEETQTIEYGSSAIAPVYEKEGYTLSWDSEFSNITEDITVNAVWTINQYTITFVSNGGSDVAEITQNYGTSLITPAEPTKIGYTFDGWYTDDTTFQNEYAFTTMPPEDITLYARWLETLEQMYNSNNVLFTDVWGDLDIDLEYSSIEDFENDFGETAMELLNTDAIVSVLLLTGMPIAFEVIGETSEVLQDMQRSINFQDLTNENGLETIIQDNIIFLDFLSINYILNGDAKLNSQEDAYINSQETALIRYIGSDNEYTVSNSVTSIGERAFYSCDSLTSITIPDSVTSIGESAFSSCSNLTSIIIPESVTNIGSFAFSGCSSLTSIMVHNNNQYYKDINGVLYNKEGTRLIQYAIGKEDESFIVPDDIKIIDKFAFSGCYSLTSITFGENSQLTSIGESAFFGCSSLTSITIPDSVTSIGERAFSWCDSLTSITIPDGVISIGDYAFLNCISLESITIPDSITSIGDSAFSYCGNLTSITIDQNNPNYHSENGNLYNKEKTIIIQYAIGKEETMFTIPDGVEIISSNAFSACQHLTSITIPDSVTSIGNYAFEDCYSLTSVTIGNGVTSIGLYAFNYCTSLTNITIPDSVTSIGAGAFNRCSGLTSITIPDSVTSISSSAFSGCDSITSITIPDSVTSIGAGAFSSCSNLTSIIIPESVTNIGSFAFSGCSSLTSIKVHNNNQYYKDINGVLYNKEGTRLIQYAIGKEDESFIVPDDIKIIDKFAFSGCYSLTSITFGENSQLTSIGEDAFYNCSNLTSITFGDNSQLITIGDYAFAFCNNLTSIAIPDSVISIGSYAFRSCSSLTSIIIPDTVISIGNNAFSGCNNIIICVETTNKLDSWNDSWNPDNRPVYWGYTGEEVTYNFETNGGSQVENILATFLEAKPITTKDGKYFGGWYDNPEFEGERISFPYYSSVDVTLYAQWLDPNQCNLEILWEQNKELISEVLNIDIEDLSLQGNNIFEIGINSLVIYNAIPIAIEFESESEINENIQFCNEIFSVIFVFGVEDEIVPLFKRIEGTKIIFLSYYFQLDYLLFGNVIFDNDAYYDKEYKILLKYTGSDSEIKLLESITAIGSQAFSGCNDITSVIIPDSVTSIGAGAFTDCSSLESIKIPDSVTCIGAGAFTGCSSLESITIPNGTTSIGSYAFVGCYALTVYSEVSSAPNGWGKYWNRYNDDYNDEYDDYYRPVIWNCILSQDKTYVVSIDKNNIDNPDSYVLNNPYREGYIFDGWYTEDDFSETKYDTIESAPSGTLYAKWIEVV